MSWDDQDLSDDFVKAAKELADQVVRTSNFIDGLTHCIVKGKTWKEFQKCMFSS